MLEIFQQESMRFYYSQFLLYLALWYTPEDLEFSQKKVHLEEGLAISREIEGPGRDLMFRRLSVGIFHE